jgi:hypothetical protein
LEAFSHDRATEDEALAKRALLRPHLRVLYMTGYTRNVIVHHGRLDAGINLISKPFSKQANFLR